MGPFDLLLPEAYGTPTECDSFNALEFTDHDNKNATKEFQVDATKAGFIFAIVLNNNILDDL